MKVEYKILEKYKGIYKKNPKKIVDDFTIIEKDNMNEFIDTDKKFLREDIILQFENGHHFFPIDRHGSHWNDWRGTQITIIVLKIEGVRTIGMNGAY